MTGPWKTTAAPAAVAARDLPGDDLGARRDDEPHGVLGGSPGRVREDVGRAEPDVDGEDTARRPVARGASAGACGRSSRPAGHRRRRPRRLAEAQLPDVRHRLDDDVVGHLRLADLAIDEDDRQFDDTEAEPMDAPRHLDLEAVALGVDGVEVDRLEHLAAKALEAAGQVAVGSPRRPRVEAAAAADHLARRLQFSTPPPLT